MTLRWKDPGYPTLHYKRMQEAKLYGCRAIAFTGIPFVLLLVGAGFGPVPPIAAAIAGAIFLIFGLLSGLGTHYDAVHYVRVIPYFQRRLGQTDR